MLTVQEERLLLHTAVTAGYLEPADAAPVPATSPAPATDGAPVFSPRIDELVRSGKLSVAQIQELREAVRQESAANTLTAGALPSSKVEPARVELEKTLDGSSAAAQAAVSAGSRSFVLNQTMGSDPEELPPPLFPVQRFPVENWDRYEFLKMLGQGGMGAVYKARDRRLGRVVALKFIRGDDQQMTQRFMQEARAQSRVDHPGICKVFDVGEVDGKAYIVMQYVDGLPLYQASKQLMLMENVQVIKDVAEALHAAHELGIIHRDIKPANIMLERTVGADGVVRNHPVLMDFGLAREGTEGKGLTESGALIGTPAYMSPEQARGDVRHLDPRSDVYSLGATLYDILSGNPPFEDESVVNIILKVLNDDVKPLQQKVPSLPEALGIIVGKCLNKEPAQRYQSAKELADDLSRFLSSQRIVGRQVSLLYRLRYRAKRNKPVAALLVALLVGLVGFAAYGTRTHLQNLKKEREARRLEEESKERSKLSQKLGQTVKEMEWLLRVSYGMPLHDTSDEKARVHAIMAEVSGELAEKGQLAAGLGSYVIGRGHLALHEWDKAHKQLKAAEATGMQSLELDYALGRAMGELYVQGMDNARKSGDKSFQEKRKKELDAEYLQPALVYLNRSRSLKTESASYAEALIDFYNRRYDAALLNAHMAQKQTPWLYEAKKLEGDVFAARALEQKEGGDAEQAEQNYLEAIRRYEQAAEIGRSDHRIYEAIAEAWIRQEEMDSYRGIDPERKLEEAIAAANRAIEAAAAESSAHTKKAYAYLFQARYEQDQHAGEKLVATLHHLILSGEQATRLNPNDEYAHDAAGLGYFYLGAYYADANEAYHQLFEKARVHFYASTVCNPAFPWAHNDLGLTFMIDGHTRLNKNMDPTKQALEAIKDFNLAVSADGGYWYPYTNISYAYNDIAAWEMEHGKDPSAVIKNSTMAAELASKINGISDMALWNTGWAYAIGAMYADNAKSDPEPYAERSVTYFNRLFLMNKNISDAYLDASRDHAVISAHRLSIGVDPSSAIRDGLSTLDKCQQVNKGVHYGCLAAEGLLLSVSGQWQQRRGLSPTQILKQALSRVRTAREHAPKDTSILLADGETCLRAATVNSTLKQPIRDELQEGFLAIEQALKLAPGWPRALGIQGGLYVLLARSQTRPVDKQSAAQRAKTAFAEAASGNPLLKKYYREFIQEAEAMAGPAK